MQKMTLGRTGLEISRTGFGALPIQRVSFDEAAALLNRAVDGGITYIDTARAYTDSEEKIGRALSGRRSEFHIATKTHAKTADAMVKDLETSLKLLKTDVIDVYQFHNPPFVPLPGGEDGLYDAAVRAREGGQNPLHRHHAALHRARRAGGRVRVVRYDSISLQPSGDRARDRAGAPLRGEERRLRGNEGALGRPGHRRAIAVRLPFAV